MGLISKLIPHLQKYGLRATFKKILWLGATRFNIVDDIVARKEKINEQLNQEFDSTIRYGVLKGYRFPEKSWWSMPDRAGMLLGIYEQELLSDIAAESKDRKYFVDIGAADGYYGVGCVSQGLFERSCCYEISPEGQETIKESAALNGVPDRVEVRGIADRASIQQLKSWEMSQTIFLIDIEGAEFDILDEENIKSISGALVYVEMHPFKLKDGQEQVEALKKRLEPYFKIELIETGARDPSQFSELRLMTDSDRWLICSEWRSALGEWWKLIPLANSHG
ncbi:FkbM family methyltransferase [Blastopirellula marina]|uniref:Methyltransferase FkbM domain-containing protein n=1 Tax=Blastopirellula marina TaxID=124 RepID=A0A2S8F9G1_9BACT|nr:FkbM family methyltransferase [Blastopirellula marina]PQO28775.1 hypothetical protein C5Y98_23640 [Blastopirellula marina]PTL42048.1 hypothetical protein C5Y97_23655 [Blastopirellula marina]